LGYPVWGSNVVDVADGNEHRTGNYGMEEANIRISPRIVGLKSTYSIIYIYVIYIYGTIFNQDEPTLLYGTKVQQSYHKTPPLDFGEFR
jgi:hypothetical protein